MADEKIKVRIVRRVKGATLKCMEHLLCEQYSIHHRMVVGLCFMATGVSMSKMLPQLGGGSLMGMFADGFGYLLHGSGCMPFIEYFSKMAKTFYEANKEVKDDAAETLKE